MKTQLRFTFEQWQAAVKVPIDQQHFINTQLDEAENLFAASLHQLKGQKDQMRYF
jgi:hypothetical protein